MMKEINIKVDVNETNKILTALGNLPYIQVYELIDKIKSQAEEQLSQNNGSESEQIVLENQENHKHNS